MSIFRKKKSKAGMGVEYSGIPRTVAPITDVYITRPISYHVANLQGIGARDRQEDSFTFANIFDMEKIREEGLLFVVCDGMGGMKDGKLASETAIASIRNSFVQMDRCGNIGKQLVESVYRAGDEVEAILEGMGGSTVIVGIIYNNELYYASVGDSYFYLKRDSHLYRLNVEHNMCNQIYLDCIRNGILNPEEGRRDNEAAALTQFLGMSGLNDVDASIRPLPIKEGDVLLACSDGVGGVLNEAEIFNALSIKDSQMICTQLEQVLLAHQKKNQDNYTALVISCCV